MLPKRRSMWRQYIYQSPGYWSHGPHTGSPSWWSAWDLTVNRSSVLENQAIWQFQTSYLTVPDALYSMISTRKYKNSCSSTDCPWFSHKKNCQQYHHLCFTKECTCPASTMWSSEVVANPGWRAVTTEGWWKVDPCHLSQCHKKHEPF